MGTSYRPGQVADLLGVSVDTVRRWTDSDRLPTRREPGGQRTIDGVDLARFLVDTAPALEDAPIVARSARNRFRGVVTRVVRDRVAATVEIQAGPHRLVSLMTAEAVDQLGLEPGMVAVASVKSTNVGVELPGG
jgi:molybdopterin-binding protein